VTPKRRLDIKLTAQVACAGCAAKVGPEDLRRALRSVPAQPRNPRVLVDHTTLDDAGVYAIGSGRALVQTVDFFPPIVDDPFDYGRVAAANALSDVYAMGGKPLTSLALVCVPDGFPPDALGQILRGGQEAMTEAGVAILGGHTIRDPEPKFGYAVTGVVTRSRMLTNAKARPGDRLVLTKPLGTGILTTALKRGQLAPDALRRVTLQMGTLNRAASEAAVASGARAATDVTGYGLLGHAQQMADASRVTFRLHPRRGWFLPGVLELAGNGVFPGGLEKNRGFYGASVDEGNHPEPLTMALYDPQTSGGLLIAIAAGRLERLRSALKRRGVWAELIGEALPRAPHAIELADA